MMEQEELQEVIPDFGECKAILQDEGDESRWRMADSHQVLPSRRSEHESYCHNLSMKRYMAPPFSKYCKGTSPTD